MLTVVLMNEDLWIAKLKYVNFNVGWVLVDVALALSISPIMTTTDGKSMQSGVVSIRPLLVRAIDSWLLPPKIRRLDF